MAKKWIKNKDKPIEIVRASLQGTGPGGEEYTITKDAKTDRYTLRIDGSLVVSSVNYKTCTNRAAIDNVTMVEC
jgi:hypothetical protein